jgi:glycosyltransferase involved in cell wall biosynthesis
MKISICIPQYNRINYLLESLRIIETQTFEHIEIVISDDCSTDDTQLKILELKQRYKYPIIYARSETNLGYDRNLREAIGLATGEYILIIGNDDTINPDCDLKDVIRFIEDSGYPDIGFSNYFEEGSGEITRRAQTTRLLGSGTEIALKYYSCFSFVGGIIIKRSVFLKYDTDKFDGSIYTQIYLATVIIASGYNLFSIEAPLIIKDVLHEQQDRLSFKDKIPRKWSEYRTLDGGLPSVLNVLICAFQETRTLDQQIVYRAFRKIYLTTLPYWIMEYRKQRALPAAVGIIQGMFPFSVKNFGQLNWYNRARVLLIYLCTSVAGLLFPLRTFDKLRPALYNIIKR